MNTRLSIYPVLFFCTSNSCMLLLCYIIKYSILKVLHSFNFLRNDALLSCLKIVNKQTRRIFAKVELCIIVIRSQIYII